MSSHNEALKLDISILEALLQRNRCAHGKTKYFQRCSMALRAMLVRANILDLQATTKTLKETLTEKVKKPTTKRKRVANEDDDLFWDLNTIQKETSLTKPPNLLDDSRTIETIQSIQDRLQTKIPEILSRIEYASKALFLEVARGFFLPFCTIALGALARIRVLVMRMGHLVLDDLQEIQHVIQNARKNTPRGTIIISDDNHLLFLSTETMSDLRNKFTKVSEEERFTASAKEERLQKLKQSIGINNGGGSGSRKKKAVLAPSSGEGDEDEGVSVAMETDQETERASTRTPANNTRITVSSHDNFDDDIGQAVLTSKNDLGVSHQPYRECHVSSATPSQTKQASEQSVAKSKKAKKDETSSKESSSKKRSKAGKSSGNSTKQQKKKRKKKDFFDDLFD